MHRLTQGPQVRFSGYVPVRHRQTNNAAELWAELQALQGFWVPKLAILIDVKYLLLGAWGQVNKCRSRGCTTSTGRLKANAPVWEKLIEEIQKPGREVRWEHVPGHTYVEGNERANVLAMEEMCTSSLRARREKGGSLDS